MIIGLTGGIGSGKSAVARILEKQGFLRVDADEVSRGLTRDGAPMLEKLAKQFGEELVVDGHLNRKALAAVVFADKEKLLELNELMHGEILTQCLEMMAKEPERDVVFDVPQLLEAGWQVYCDKVWVVTADKDTRIKRVMRRDGMSEAEVVARMNNQMNDEERMALADVVIENNGSLAKLRKSVLKVLGL